jgi:hypothetical protein
MKKIIGIVVCIAIGMTLFFCVNGIISYNKHKKDVVASGVFDRVECQVGFLSSITVIYFKGGSVTCIQGVPQTFPAVKGNYVTIYRDGTGIVQRDYKEEK